MNVGSDKKEWERFEEHVAELIGGERVRGSGASDQHKGDVMSDKFLVECKQTDLRSYRVHDGRVKKIALEAMSRNRDWLFCVRTPYGDWCMVPMILVPDGFPMSEYEQREVGRTAEIGKGTDECIVSFGSGRRVLLLELEHAVEVLNGD